jgi:DNA-3-methyladenine glycosylase
MPRAFFARPGVEVAPELLGLLVVRRLADGIRVGAIVEVEAYGGPDDLASHARAGRTRRTATMFGPPGHAYVYQVYGLHFCLNVVTETDRAAGAILLRALEPVAGVEGMRMARGPTAGPDVRIAAGPARLCQALEIDRSLDAVDLTAEGPLYVAHPGDEELDRLRARGVAVGTRVGVSYAGADWASRPWRFGLRDHPALSRPFDAHVGAMPRPIGGFESPTP